MLRILPAVLVLFIFGSVAIGQEPNSKINPWVMRHTEGGNSCEFIVLMKDQADLSPAATLPTKAQKGAFVYSTLYALAERTQKPILEALRAVGVPHRSFYIVNAIWVRAGRGTVLELAAREDVWLIEGNPKTKGLLSDVEARARVESTLAIEPNILYTNADQVWAMGFTGQGVVVGGQDTGYQWDHPALINSYRGWNGTIAVHDYNWHDSIHSGGGVCGSNAPAPCDDHGHGTHTMGTVLGDDGGSNQIGMAPGAQWICSRNMDQGNGTPATYMESFEFFLAPYPVGGTPAQGQPLQAPDVTTNSWSCPPVEGCTANSLLLSCQAERAAGILTVVAAGNSGSGCSTVSSPPAIYDECFTVGAHRHTNGSLAGFSSRGPVTVDGSGRMKPDIAAPGVSVRSCTPGNSYQGGWNGTSMATPHVAGAAALLISAHPQLQGQVDALEQVLQDSATHVSSTSCSSSNWPNNLWGYGRMDVLQAVNSVRGVSILPLTPSVGVPGHTIHQIITIQNDGYLDDSFTVTIAGPWASGGSVSVGPMQPGSTQTFSISLTIPAVVVPGTTVNHTVTATSQNWAAASASVNLNLTASGTAPCLTLSQPMGPGGGVIVQNDNLQAGHEYYNIFVLESCLTGQGTGPWLGLCSTTPNDLLLQFQLPVNTIPFHFVPGGASTSFGPYPIPAGTVIEGICFDWTGATLGDYSPVATITVQ